MHTWRALWTEKKFCSLQTPFVQNVLMWSFQGTPDALWIEIPSVPFPRFGVVIFNNRLSYAMHARKSSGWFSDDIFVSSDTTPRA